MAIADLGMRYGLRALNGFASLGLLDRFGMREPAERLIYGASKNSVRAAGRAGRAFDAVNRRSKPARPSTAPRADLFDLTPSDEQQMLRESFRQVATDRLRPAAHDADMASSAPAELMAEASELGITMLGVPEELGGVVDERSAVTSVLIGEALAHGDMGLAVAALAPAAVSTALGLWGDADQQSAYLPAFVGDDVPAAALALLEPRPLFDPESKTEGVFTEPDPAMGLRPAATGRLMLDGVALPAGALIAEGDPIVYGECVQRARLAWCSLAVGCAQAVLDYVTPYVNERVAFGEPISNRQAVAFGVANIGIELEGMRLATYRAAARADQGLDFAHATTLARQLCSEKGMAIGSDGVQLLGGHGFVKEHPVERWYRDLRAAGLMEGALLV